MTRVAIIGAGRGGTGLIEILHKDPNVRVVGIVDVNSDAPGIDLARRFGIPTYSDFKRLLKEGADIVIDVTGNPKVKEALDRQSGKMEVIGGLAAKIMWELIEERIKSRALKEELHSRYSFENIIGKSEKLQEIFRLLPEIARTKATVLIEGESGTGKEMIAHAVHQFSPREDKPFLKINCGALAEGILESELFGHVKGAFTGAMLHKVGRFELAHGGTIFLDEIGDISPTLQIKLLRVVQESEFEKVGDSRRIKVDVRIIAATNKDLKAAVAKGEFRQDLYYRLHVVPIYLPPLRERKEDIRLLVDHFINRFNREMGKKVTRVSPEALQILMNYDYPGNIRELENIIEHVLVLVHGETILPEHLQTDIQIRRAELITRAANHPSPLRAVERELLSRVLEQTGWNYRRAAAKLRISRTTLWRKIKRHKIIHPNTEHA